MSSKQPSRKGKKAWRKNVDITDVQSGLEQLREEVITGGVVKEKSNELIFSVDLGGDEKIIKKEGPTLPKPLKADEVLAARSAIPAVAARKRKSCNVTDGLVEFKKKHKNGISFAQLQRLRGIAYGGQSTTTVLTKPGKSLPDYDPWAEPNPLAINAAEADDNKFDFIEKKKPIKAPATLKHKPIALSATGTVPAVRLPAAGISYNPQYEKWEELLHEEGEKEVVREKKRLEQEAEERRIAELTAQPDPESASGSEESEDDQQTEARNTVIREAKRKTQAQKNKARRLKEIEMKRGEERKLKKQERELLLVKKYARDLKKRENLRIANAIAKKTIVDDKKNPKIMRKKKFGKVEMPPAPLEIQLTDELTDSLRKLKPEGNLLSDRFRSLRERGLVETRTPTIYAKKAKKHATEKWSYKDFK